jgi:hypothetical protein
MMMDLTTLQHKILYWNISSMWWLPDENQQMIRLKCTSLWDPNQIARLTQKWNFDTVE